jgi:hypothetical protein
MLRNGAAPPAPRPAPPVPRPALACCSACGRAGRGLMAPMAPMAGRATVGRRAGHTPHGNGGGARRRRPTASGRPRRAASPGANPGTLPRASRPSPGFVCTRRRRRQPPLTPRAGVSVRRFRQAGGSSSPRPCCPRRRRCRPRARRHRRRAGAGRAWATVCRCRGTGARPHRRWSRRALGTPPTAHGSPALSRARSQVRPSPPPPASPRPPPAPSPPPARLRRPQVLQRHVAAGYAARMARARRRAAARRLPPGGRRAARRQRLQQRPAVPPRTPSDAPPGARHLSRYRRRLVTLPLPPH